MTDVLIIGGGAAGLACAVTAAQRGLTVTVLERMDRVGRKLLATGAGRCNLMNMEPAAYPRGGKFAEQVLSRCGPEEQTAFWRGLGLRLRREEAGRVYPVTGQASSVLDALRFACGRLGVTILTDCRAAEIRRQGGLFVCLTEDGRSLKARQLFLAAGGCAQSKLGSDGSGAALLKQLGHRVSSFRPVLTALESEGRRLNGLSGLRLRAGVTVEAEGQVLHREDGEVLFTDYGVSGVCVMNCSGYLPEKGSARLLLDVLPQLGIASREEMLR